jgi:hypothetical protein
MKMNWFRLSISLVLLSFLLSACGGDSSSSPSPNAKSQMGGAIQGKPLSLSQSVSTLAGSAGNSGSTDGTGTDARFINSWGGITTDGTNLFVADYNTVRKVVIATGAVTTLAGIAGNPGSADGTGAEASFRCPYATTTDGTNLFVFDANDIGNYTIRKVVIATGAVTTLAGNDGSLGAVTIVTPAIWLGRPQGITTDGKNVYVADSGSFTIRKVVIATGAVTTLAGSAGSSGLTDGSGMEARFNLPCGITTDGTNLFVTDVSDIGNYTIRKVRIATGTVTTLVGRNGSLGTVDVTQGIQVAFPQGVTTDGTNLFVADPANFMIRKVVIATGAVTTLAGSAGIRGSADGTGADARFFIPQGITTDGTSLFVADGGNFTIRKID